MNRRAFLATTAAAATAATVKAASAATVTPFGETGVPASSAGPLPLGPLSGSVYPDPHLESMVKPNEPTFGPAGFPAFAGTMAWNALRRGSAGPRAQCISRQDGMCCLATFPTTASCAWTKTTNTATSSASRR